MMNMRGRSDGSKIKSKLSNDKQFNKDNLNIEDFGMSGNIKWGDANLKI